MAEFLWNFWKILSQLSVNFRQIVGDLYSNECIKILGWNSHHKYFPELQRCSGHNTVQYAVSRSNTHFLSPISFWKDLKLTNMIASGNPTLQ